MEKHTPDKRGSVDRYHSPQPMLCRIHGNTLHAWRFDKRVNRGRWRCRKCAYESMVKRRKRLKEKLVELFGSACKICGYNKSLRALTFHHRDPKTKLFGIGEAQIIGWDKLLVEAQKCDLLCANCHAEIEDSLVG